MHVYCMRGVGVADGSAPQMHSTAKTRRPSRHPA
jgi:hypothetical protein